MAKSIFVSYNFNDREVCDKVKGMMMEHVNDIHGKVVFVENDVSYNGATAVDWEIEHVMEDCDAALFVLGEAYHSSPWFDREIAHAKEKHIPMMATVLPGENVEIPESLTAEGCKMLNWNSDEMCDCMNSIEADA
jgi:hypothetical protein